MSVVFFLGDRQPARSRNHWAATMWIYCCCHYFQSHCSYYCYSLALPSLGCKPLLLMMFWYTVGHPGLSTGTGPRVFDLHRVRHLPGIILPGDIPGNATQCLAQPGLFIQPEALPPRPFSRMLALLGPNPSILALPPAFYSVPSSPGLWETILYLDGLDLRWSPQDFAPYRLPHFGAIPSVAMSPWPYLHCLGHSQPLPIQVSSIRPWEGSALHQGGSATHGAKPLLENKTPFRIPPGNDPHASCKPEFNS